MGSRGQNFGVKSHISTPGPKFGVQMFTVPRAGRDLDVCSRRRSQKRGESEPAFHKQVAKVAAHVWKHILIPADISHK